MSEINAAVLAVSDPIIPSCFKRDIGEGAVSLETGLNHAEMTGCEY